MGHDIKRVKEPEANAIAKRLAKPGRPCAVELVGLMDCMKRNATGDADDACARERAALARCAAQQGAQGKNAGVGRKELVKYLQEFASAMKRYRH